MIQVITDVCLNILITKLRILLIFYLMNESVFLFVTSHCWKTICELIFPQCNSVLAIKDGNNSAKCFCRSLPEHCLIMIKCLYTFRLTIFYLSCSHHPSIMIALLFTYHYLIISELRSKERRLVICLLSL